MALEYASTKRLKFRLGNDKKIVKIQLVADAMIGNQQILSLMGMKPLPSSYKFLNMTILFIEKNLFKWTRTQKQ